MKAKPKRKKDFGAWGAGTTRQNGAINGKLLDAMVQSDKALPRKARRALKAKGWKGPEAGS